MTVALVPIQPADLDLYWPLVEPWVEAAASDIASWAVSDWRHKVETRHAQLWVVRIGSVPTGVIITEIYDTAAGKTCALPIVGGSHLNESLPVLEEIEAWAKEQGCTRLQGDGREGWIRALKGLGWRPVSIQIAKEIA
jgi:hypothetical protein